MNIDINIDNFTEEEKEQFWTLVSASREREVWKPKQGEAVYRIEYSGEVYNFTFYNDIHSKVIDFGNVFKTREEAEFMAMRLKVIKELKDFAQKHNESIDWTDSNNQKCYISFSANNDCITYGITYRTKTNDIFFSSQKKRLKKSVKKELRNII